MNAIMWRKSVRGVVANVPNFNIVGSEFEIKRRNYFHIWTNTLG